LNCSTAAPSEYLHMAPALSTPQQLYPNLSWRYG